MSYSERNADTAVFAGGVNLLAGLWLIVSPWVFGYEAQPGALWNSIIVGIVIVVLAAARQFGAASGWSWVNAVLGAWMIASPFVYHYTPDLAGTWNSIIVGLIVVILAATSGMSGETVADIADVRGDGRYGRRAGSDWERDRFGTGAWWTRGMAMPATGSYRGRGPRGYSRSDEQIRSEIADRMAEHPYLDASEIDLSVEGGDVWLRGTIADRSARRLAEDVADSVVGVHDVHNELRIRGGQGQIEAPRRVA
jgi:hypothetical protein